MGSIDRYRLRYHCVALFLGSLVFTFVELRPARAQEAVESHLRDDLALVRIFVRAIHAQSHLGLETVLPHDVMPTKIDPGLKDLQSRLIPLPFSSFRLLSSVTEEINLRKKALVHLPLGQTLAFRPMSSDSNKVSLWLSWKDMKGGEILGTKIQISPKETILTGTDGNEDEGYILAIRAEPVPGK
jgi:hypothetical protein